MFECLRKRLPKVLVAGSMIWSSIVLADDDLIANMSVPNGYTVEVVAEAPLVNHPLMGCFDEEGRLYLAANAGMNLERSELEAQLPNYIQRLEDTDGDGRFDRSVIFADKLTFPQGCLWHRGSLYVASSGAIWKFTDSNGDGVADERVKLVGNFGYTGNAADIHGPFSGPDDRLYWCDGRHGHEIQDAAGNLVSRGKASRIFSCKFDGTDLQTFSLGGMDNPVEVVFTPRGEMLGTVNLLYSTPRGDCLVNWQYGGVYPREDFVENLESEFIRTGPLLKEVHHFGHVAVSGLCLIENAELKENEAEKVLVTQFNSNRLSLVTLRTEGSGYATEKVEDFLVSTSSDFHPTDVLQDADGSFLVIDTGGWFRIGCPESQVAKSHLKGAIYRVRRSDAAVVDDSRGLKLDWQNATAEDLLNRLGVDRPAVQQRAVQALADLLNANWNLETANELTAQIVKKNLEDRLMWIQVLSRVFHPEAAAFLVGGLEDQSEEVRLLTLRNLLYSQRVEGDMEEVAYQSLLNLVQKGTVAESKGALATLGRMFSDRSELAVDLYQLVTPHFNDLNWRHAFVYCLIESGDRESVGAGLFHQDPDVQLAAADALEQLRRPHVDLSEQRWVEIPAAGSGTPLSEADQAHLVEVLQNLPAGEVERGRELFNSERGACAKCHRVKSEGGLIGPDLSTIGKSRSRLDLLEALLYPSASFARGFAPYVVLATDGRTASGIVLSESSKGIRLGVSVEQSVEVGIDEVEEMKASDVSIMPNEVVKQLTEQELADLVAYVESLK
ncbi:PVC-type heme-binding CxxCH protein [Planctomicrobium sp. SH668]|uniref:PVC-type heme-binding CxxCH protein n=1 Tax=Planctomicrobium sp. SH668 TaxID=3448126 RepID=UPI003F5B1B3E